MHRFWDCSVPSCQRAASIDNGGCERCQAMFCAGHVDHGCDKTPLDDDAWLAAQTAELAALASKVNEQALLRRARNLSGGINCHLDADDPLGRCLMGGMNVHRQLLFDDGAVWLVRMLRDNYTSFDDETSNQILLSECATLTWLQTHVPSIPAPRLHGFGLRGDANNEVGVAYMLIGKLPGKPCNVHSAAPEQTAKVLDQWAGMLCELERHPLDKLGSLQFASGNVSQGDEVVVGPVAGDRTGTLPCTLPYTLGPFSDARSFYASWADTHLDAISDGQLFSQYPVDAYLMFNWIKQQVESDNFTQWPSLHTGPFFLRHVDDKGDHLLVDDDFNITGVIDWTFARTAPAYEAFAPALVTASTNDLFSGTPGLSEEDRILEKDLRRRDTRDTPHCYFEDDSMRRLLFGIGVGLGLSLQEAIDVFRCFVSTWSNANDTETIPGWKAWRAAELARWRNKDTRLATLFHLEQPSPPRFTTCAFSSGCGRPGVRGSCCPVCKGHFCAFHRRPQYHTCIAPDLDDEAWEQSIIDEVDALLAQANISALERRASVLRNGVACRFRRSKHQGEGHMMGCANYHAWLDFSDGVRWLARIPRVTDGSDVPADLVDHLVASEYATLRFIGQTMPQVRVPRAYGYGLVGDASNDVGVTYLLEEALPGKPFQAYEATEEQKQHVFRQYADILAEISRHPVKQVCSLVPGDNGELEKSGIASDRFVRLSQHGPYSSALAYYTSVAELHLDLIADGQIFADYPKEAFGFYRLLRDNVAPVLASLNDDCLSLQGFFFLKHVDDKGDHILVDADYNITGIIDWQFARFVPPAEAFGLSLVTADMGNLYDGKIGSSSDDTFMAGLLRDKGISTTLAFDNELARRFHFGLASGMAKEDVLGMTKAVLTLLNADHGDGDGDMTAWVEATWANAKEDNDPRWYDIEMSLDSERP